MLRMDKSVSNEDKMKRINQLLKDVLIQINILSKLFLK